MNDRLLSLIQAVAVVRADLVNALSFECRQGVAGTPRGATKMSAVFSAAVCATAEAMGLTRWHVGEARLAVSSRRVREARRLRRAGLPYEAKDLACEVVGEGPDKHYVAYSDLPSTPWAIDAGAWLWSVPRDGRAGYMIVFAEFSATGKMVAAAYTRDSSQCIASTAVLESFTVHPAPAGAAGRLLTPDLMDVVDRVVAATVPGRPAEAADETPPPESPQP